MSRSGALLAAAIGAAAIVAACSGLAGGAEGDDAQARLWNDVALREWALPVAGLGVRPDFVAPDDYYARAVDDLRTYPVYHPSREPAGYRAALVARGPQKLIPDPAALVTDADWIEAGKRVFEELDTIATRTDDPEVIAHFTDAAAIDRARDAKHDVVDADGVMLGYRWVVDHDGALKLSLGSCADCHTHILPDGSLLFGGPSNANLAPTAAVGKLLAPLAPLPPGEQLWMDHGVPWRADDPHAPLRAADEAAIGALLGGEHGQPPGTTVARVHGSPFFTTRNADLRGVRHRRFLDATASHRNRGPDDLARYAILVEFADLGAFGPHRMFPAAELAKQQARRRPSDAAMRALGRYLWSLDPPPSPQPVDDRARRGQAVFEAEGCGRCHRPPHYTHDQLVAVPGFDPAAAAAMGVPVMDRTVDTDPGLALRTRKGTGFYRVPSLRGLWYRDLLEHSGSIRTLEDWFDPRRLDADYVPTGWRGPGVRKRAVPGHEFGLDLPADDKAALIAFLRTL